MPFNKNDFKENIKGKHIKYYLYNEFFKPAEYAFFGAFLGIYLAFLFFDILNIPLPKGYAFHGDFIVQKYAFAIWLTFYSLVSLGGIIAAFDYTLRAGTRAIIYIVVLLIYVLFAVSLRSFQVYQVIPKMLKLKSICTLPTLFIFWIAFRELMRVYSKVTYKFRKETYFRE